MEADYAIDVPNQILLALLAFSIALLFEGDFFCPMRAKTFIDHVPSSIVDLPSSHFSRRCPGPQPSIPCLAAVNRRVNH
jgi:hypothetical protein